MSYETIYKYDQRTVNARDAAKALNAYCGALVPQGMSVQDIQQYRLENNDDLLLLFYVAEYYKTASGNPASFSDGADDIPVRELTVAIDTVQQGSGTPSVENPRLFVPKTGVTITHNNKAPLVIPFGAEAGDVYGGTLNVTTGILTVTHRFIEYDGSENWADAYPAWTNKLFYTKVDDDMVAVADSGIFSVLSPRTSFSDNTQIGARIYNYTNSRFVCRFAENFETVQAFKEYLSGLKTARTPLQCVYQLETPVTYRISENEIKTLLGANNIACDTGDVSVTYRAVPGLG